MFSLRMDVFLSDGSYVATFLLICSVPRPCQFTWQYEAVSKQ